ncbi:MAG: hypothetical protein II557_05375, partial [Clostridia bacterium]|nr:hypothetical protein [Clostridia bacterium]
MNKRAFSLLLALLFSASCLIGCSESKTNADEGAPAAPVNETPAAVNPEDEPEDETAEILPDIPELDFGGSDYVICTSGSSDDNGVDWVTYDVYVEELNGEVINDAVFERNLYLNETYNINLRADVTSGAVHSSLQTDVKAGGGTYDAGFTGIMRGQTLGTQGITHNMFAVPYVDLSKPWWDHRLTEDCTLLGDVYLGTGDITVIDNDATWILMFNKQMHDDLGLEDLYTLVREDRWYYDTLYTMLQTATRDTDGNGKLQPKIDTFGFVTTANTCYGLFYASGEQMAPKDEEGIPTLRTDLDRITSVVEKAGMILGDLDHVFVADRTGYGTDDLRYIFEEGRALFYGEVAQCIT